MQTEIKPHYDVVIIGAGPAGMSASLTLSNYGLSVAVFDEQVRPGGQIYRNVQNAQQVMGQVTDNDRFSRATVAHGSELTARFMNCAVNYFAQSFVWSVESLSVIAVNWHERVFQTSCRYLIVATGAQERPVPFKGWELPGVMGVGAAQIMLKSAGAVPQAAPVLFGSGPLLYLYATQLIASNLPPAAILDTTSFRNSIKALRHLPRALKAVSYLRDGFNLLKTIRAAGVAHYKHVTSVTAYGDDRLQGVEFTASGKTLNCETDLLLSHHGVVPETQLLRAIGVECYLDESAQCWRPVLDEWGASRVEGVYVCGDNASVNGAYNAEYDAALASFDILFRAGVITESERNKLAVPECDAAKRDKSIRPFLVSKYKVADTLLCASGDTLVCRCESVTAAQIVEAVSHGCHGPNQVKSFTRCGMGACQGRMCGPAVESIIARKTGRSRAEVGQFRVRPPLRPVSLAAIASLDQG